VPTFFTEPEQPNRSINPSIHQSNRRFEREALSRARTIPRSTVGTLAHALALGHNLLEQIIARQRLELGIAQLQNVLLSLGRLEQHAAARLADDLEYLVDGAKVANVEDWYAEIDEAKVARTCDEVLAACRAASGLLAHAETAIEAAVLDRVLGRRRLVDLLVHDLQVAHALHIDRRQERELDLGTGTWHTT